jgi:hypothetical protein
MRSSRSFLALAIVMCILLGHPRTVSAQHVEVAPFFGVRAGGDFFELVTSRPADLDAAQSVGLVVDVRLRDGLHVEALFTHQDAGVDVPATTLGPASRSRMTVDHWMVGGLQEFGGDRARPLLTGLLGLTRYAANADTETRFTASAGGVKLFPFSRLGARLDGRVFATLVDAEGRAVACSPGFCLVGFKVDVAWQAELTAGVVVVF